MISNYSKTEITQMLGLDGPEADELLARADRIRRETIGEKIYVRGLIEYSNVCRKNCFYCGIRNESKCKRYTLSHGEVLESARIVLHKNYGSLVLQGGENQSREHIRNIETLVKGIKKLSDGKLGITLSLGEQSDDTYKRWFDAGAHRYLLRIETTSSEVYKRIHPDDELHKQSDRYLALKSLRKIGYQVGTGVMIGLPFQTLEDLAEDLIFMKEFDVDMCGMGPYLVSTDTPLARYSDSLIPMIERLRLGLKMIAILRIMMPDINIASTTALQTIDPNGRIMGIRSGANIIMPNVSPKEVRTNYLLYDNKPMSLDSSVLESMIAYGLWGDSEHFKKRKK